MLFLQSADFVLFFHLFQSANFTSPTTSSVISGGVTIHFIYLINYWDGGPSVQILPFKENVQKIKTYIFIVKP